MFSFQGRHFHFLLGGQIFILFFDATGPGPPRGGGGAGGGKIPGARRLLGARQGPAGPLMSTFST